MPFLPDLTIKIKSFFGALWRRLRAFAPKLPGKIHIENRRLALICAGGGLVVVLMFVVLALLLTNRPAAIPARAENTGFRQAAIPPEEIFLPEEPDFIPGVMPGRRQRSNWTAEDAAPFWQDPLKNGEEQWRERLEAAIDELMERVP